MPWVEGVRGDGDEPWHVKAHDTPVEAFGVVALLFLFDPSNRRKVVTCEIKGLGIHARD